ncbi:hypothetical protein QTN25_005129 [Entamoeba marina]
MSVPSIRLPPDNDSDFTTSPLSHHSPLPRNLIHQDKTENNSSLADSLPLINNTNQISDIITNTNSVNEQLNTNSNTKVINQGDESTKLQSDTTELPMKNIMEESLTEVEVQNHNQNIPLKITNDYTLKSDRFSINNTSISTTTTTSLTPEPTQLDKEMNANSSTNEKQKMETEGINEKIERDNSKDTHLKEIILNFATGEEKNRRKPQPHIPVDNSVEKKKPKLAASGKSRQVQPHTNSDWKKIKKQMVVGYFIQETWVDVNGKVVESFIPQTKKVVDPNTQFQV